MSVQPIVCDACGSEVPYGRLSCAQCGQLLASVAGVHRASPIGATEHADGDGPTTTLPGAGAPVATRPLPPVLADVGPRVRAADRPVAAATPGAYVPPPVFAADFPSMPAAVPAPARAWAGTNGSDADVVTPTGSASPAEGAGRSLGSIDAAKVEEFAGWLAVAGSALAAVGFLLPWSDSVVGASGVGYFDRWGLAGPGHPLVVLGLLGVLALGVVRNPVPVWVRVGLPGLGLGALLIGLVWPYQLGPLGADPGALAVTVGAVMLVAAGIIALAGRRSDRHAEHDQSV